MYGSSINRNHIEFGEIRQKDSRGRQTDITRQTNSTIKQKDTTYSVPPTWCGLTGPSQTIRMWRQILRGSSSLMFIEEKSVRERVCGKGRESSEDCGKECSKESK